MHAAESALLRQAEGALSENIPQVAIAKLKAFIALPDLSGDQREQALRAMGKSLLADAQFTEALDAIAPLVAARQSQALLLRADILVALERWPEALALYTELAADTGAPMAAHLGKAEALRATGQLGKAVEVLESLVAAGKASVSARLRLVNLYIEAADVKKAHTALSGVESVRPQDRKWKTYLEGRLFLLEDHPEAARMSFKALLADTPAERQDLSESLLVGATLGLADARIIAEGYESADAELETFISHNPNSTYLEVVFARLDAIYSKEDDAPENELKNWTVQPSERRAALARFYLARLQLRAKRVDKAERTLDSFIKLHPSHPLGVSVYEMEAEIFEQKGDFTGALRVLDAAQRQTGASKLAVAARARIELHTGLVHYQAGDYLLADKNFDNAAKHSPELLEPALYNRALAALSQRNFERFQELDAELNSKFPASPIRSGLLLEQGLLQARLGNSLAPGSLRRFLLDYPSHPRAAEAQLALVELAFRDADYSAAADYRKAVNEASLPAALSDQSQYLALFLADAQSPRRDQEVVELATKFIKGNPKSALLPEVRMKLGQVYFRKEDFPNAETQFGTLVNESPESDYAETALFLAGRSAMKSINEGSRERAFQIFDRVVARGGELLLYARLQQAVLKSSAGKEEEAIQLDDFILEKQPADPDLMYAAFMGKADSLLNLGRNDEKRLEQAAAAYAQLAALESVPAVWRNQALYKKAQALDLLSRKTEALSAYYDVLDSGVAGKDQEYVWFYKAGFEAARMFEAQEKWPQAIAIYQKMSVQDGPRAAEAKGRIKQLRLEHFIWE